MSALRLPIISAPAPKINASGATAASAISSGVESDAMNAANLSMPSTFEESGTPRSALNRSGIVPAFMTTMMALSTKVTVRAHLSRAHAR